MTALTLEEIRDYCAHLSIGIRTGHHQRQHAYFERCAECRVYVGKFADAASAAFDMAATMVAPERDNFKGAVVWLTGWTPSFENNEAAFVRVRKGFGVHAPIRERPGHRFGPEEFADAKILMGFLMNFGWDGIWVPAHGEYLMAINNDLLIDFAVRGGKGRWDAERKELFDNLDVRHWPQMTSSYCLG